MSNNRIMKALSGFYYVQTDHGLIECRARGRFRNEHLSPLVGDLVQISEQNGKGMIDCILPRKNEFVRPAVANIDLLVILASCAVPQTEPFLIDRITAIAQRQNVPCLIVVNKNDLINAQPLLRIYQNAGFSVLATSAENGEGIEQLRSMIAGKLAAFTGNSGVGKSSILNCLCPDLQLPVGEVSQKLGRGKHTTRHIELYPLAERTYIADTPGFSSFDTDRVDDILKEELASAFSDFAPFLGKCQFCDCAHLKEPGCAVLQALEQGKLEKSRYASYVRLYDIVKEKKSWE